MNEHAMQKDMDINDGGKATKGRRQSQWHTEANGLMELLNEWARNKVECIAARMRVVVCVEGKWLREKIANR